MRWSTKELAASLNMPKTSFPLRPDHASIEERFRKRISEDMYRWQESNRKDTPVFRLHDGPPFANGDLHIGHALNKILKDMILRYNLMTGHRVEYVPGWDCHGLPIEMRAIKEGDCTDVLELRKKCSEFASATIGRQRDNMKQWGLLFDPDKGYRTMDKSYEARQLRVFAKFLERGLIHSALRPVYWSPSSRTALAEGELEYKDDHEIVAAYAGFALSNAQEDIRRIVGNEPVYLMIWTTTPWTLPANRAIAVNASMEYHIVRRNRKYIICGSSGLSSLAGTPVGKISGNALLHCKYINTTGETCPIFEAPFVSSDTGTGLVHLAPAYGMEDFLLCQENGIKPVDILTDDGRFSSKAPSVLSGLSIFSPDVVERIGKTFEVFFPHKHLHRAPVDWRTKEAVIQRATQQLFINTQKLLPELSAALDSIEFYPAIGKVRLAKMLETRQEWCISRQRSWGVPIPVLYDGDRPVLDPRIALKAAEIFEKEGSDAWWKRPVKDFVPDELPVTSTLRKGTDTMDIWFDSGTSWSGIAGVADVYLEGADQFRGWFQSSLITSVATTGKVPTKKIISHGFVVDAHGLKMSKLIGNVVAPSAIIENKSGPRGIDLLRSWVASADWTRDAAIGSKILRTISDVQQKIRNTCRYMLGNLYDFEAKLDGVSLEQMWAIDRALMERADEVSCSVKDAYGRLDFISVLTQIHQFCSDDLSSFYICTTKDRLYSDLQSSVERRSAQTALDYTLSSLNRLMAPALPFLAEEVHEARGVQGSIFQLLMPENQASRKSSEHSFSQLRSLRDNVRERYGSVEKLSISAAKNPLGDLEQLRELLGASDVQLDIGQPEFDMDGRLSIVAVQPTSFTKCPRCWMYYGEEDELCSRCTVIISTTSSFANSLKQ